MLRASPPAHGARRAPAVRGRDQLLPLLDGGPAVCPRDDDLPRDARGGCYRGTELPCGSATRRRRCTVRFATLAEQHARRSMLHRARAHAGPNAPCAGGRRAAAGGRRRCGRLRHAPRPDRASGAGAGPSSRVRSPRRPHAARPAARINPRARTRATTRASDQIGRTPAGRHSSNEEDHASTRIGIRHGIGAGPERAGIRAARASRRRRTARRPTRCREWNTITHTWDTITPRWDTPCITTTARCPACTAPTR